MRRNWIGETRREEIERRLGAVEGAIQELNIRIDNLMFTHLQEFHPDQEGYVPEPKES